MRADVIFDRVLGQVFARLGGDLETNLLRVARFVFVALVTSSLLVSLLRRDGACKTLPREGRAHVASVASVLPVLVMLDVVYLAFALVQCGYLFGGASASEVAGGYARYARSGFFELIAVAAINVCVLLATLWARRDAVRSRVVDASQLVLLALTLVVDASAAWRMGPGAGEMGGRVVAAGTPEQIAANPDSLTGAYLTGARQIRLPDERRHPDRGRITITGAEANNLKDVTASIELGTLTVVTGVSGSGKSSLVTDTLAPALTNAVHRSKRMRSVLYCVLAGVPSLVVTYGLAFVLGMPEARLIKSLTRRFLRRG